MTTYSLKDTSITFGGQVIPAEHIESIELVPAADDVQLPEGTLGVFKPVEIEMTMTVEPGAWAVIRRDLREMERRALQEAAVKAQTLGRICFEWGPFLRFAWADVPVTLLPGWLRGPFALALRTAELAYRARRLRRIPVRVGTYPIIRFSVAR